MNAWVSYYRGRGYYCGVAAYYCSCCSLYYYHYHHYDNYYYYYYYYQVSDPCLREFLIRPALVSDSPAWFLICGGLVSDSARGGF